MTDIKEQQILPDGTDSRPLVSIVMNFTKPTDTKPSLLTPQEVRTFLHEFGHALHSLLSKVNYKSLSGTNVYRDFVELPSQFNENFLTHREFLDTFAFHYETGEPIPQQLIDRWKESQQFGAAYDCMRQLYFGFLDMAWHTITAPHNDVAQLEQEATKEVQAFEPLPGCMVSPQFSHIFAGGYAAGYYSYNGLKYLMRMLSAYLNAKACSTKTQPCVSDMRFWKKEVLKNLMSCIAVLEKESQVLTLC